MGFSSSTVSIGASTKKADYDNLLDNTQWNKGRLDTVYDGVNTFAGNKTFSGTVSIEGAATLSGGVAGETVFNSSTIFTENTKSNGYYYNNVTAGSNLLVCEDSSKDTQSGSYIKLKEILCPADGILTTKFTIRTSSANNDSWGKIYVNGGAVGDEHNNPSNIFIEYTDESIPVAKNDLIQVYCKVEAGGFRVYVKDFRIYCNEDVGAVTLKLYEVLGLA